MEVIVSWQNMMPCSDCICIAVWSWNPLRTTLIFMKFSTSANNHFSFSPLLLTSKTATGIFCPETSLKCYFPLTMKISTSCKLLTVYTIKHWKLSGRSISHFFVMNAHYPQLSENVSHWYSVVLCMVLQSQGRKRKFKNSINHICIHSSCGSRFHFHIHEHWV